VSLTDNTARWPHPVYDATRQPHVLFIITPPFSGSTAIAGLLNTSPRTMLLQERGEGQWLVPGLCENDRWDGNKEVDYESVRAVWLNCWQQAALANPHIDVVIEKSPPNMVRLDALATLFPDHSLLANNRDPYANCASILYRNHPAAQLGTAERQHLLRGLASDWQQRSMKIRELVCRLDIPLLTYEEFCDNPASIIARLELPAGVAETIDVHAQVKVKDYPMQGIANQNRRQIDLLSDEELMAISHVLATDLELLDFFSYEIA